MREINFRAWDGKQYFYDVVPLFNSREIILNHWASGNTLHKVECFEQDTGVEDVKERNIYEGDIIVIYRDEDYDPKEMYLEFSVEYGHSCSCIEESEDVFGWNIDPHEDYLIIGNKYENPELLK